MKESYIDELKEKILLYAKNNGMEQENVPLKTIIRILIEIRIERLRGQRQPLFSNGISMGKSDYDFLSEILNTLETQFWQITDECSSKRKEMLKKEGEKQLSQNRRL
jgi:hypothetical protein